MNYRNKIERFFQDTLDVLYPIRIGDKEKDLGDLKSLISQWRIILNENIEPYSGDAILLNEELFTFLINIKEELNKDVDAIYKGDPASRNHNEIIIAYPGFYAIAAYRIAHFLLNKSVPLIPRIMSEHAHSYTGIDIHPGANIGSHLCIDHGTGVVIGETTNIGDHVKIYQGVTLGALSVPERNSTEKRHPTIEDHVVIYSQAVILGGDTVIGRHSVIGGNVWITRSVEPFSKAYYKGGNNLTIEKIRKFRA